MKKILSIILLIGILLSTALAYAPLTRIRNFVNDKNNGIPITSSYMDAEFNQILTALNLTAVVQGSAPGSPTNGALWFDTTNNVLKIFRFNEWVQMNPIHAGAVMANPQNNDLWINNTGAQDHLKIYDINGVNWNDIPTVPKINGVNWLVPIFTGVNWEGAIINTGVNWNNLKPIIFNGINWDDPSYAPATNASWQYQSFGSNPKWAKSTWSPNNIQIFTGAGTYTWTKPAGVSNVYVRLWGGGGFGQGSNQNGAGGEYTEAPDAVTGNITVTVGTGGTATDGTASSFAGTVTLSANGGQVCSHGGAGGTGGTHTNGFSFPGQSGCTGIGYSPLLSGYGQGGLASANGSDGAVIVYY